MDARNFHGSKNSADLQGHMSNSHSAVTLSQKAFPQFLHNTVCVLNHHLELACVGKWIWTESCWLWLVIARKNWRKWIYCRKFCQQFQYITVLLATMFVIPAANIPLVLFQLCLSFHIHLFSLHSCTPYPSAPTTYKSSQGNSTSP